MYLDTQTILLGSVCLLGAVVHVFAKWKNVPWMAGLAKGTASLTFLVLAVVEGSLVSGYGKAVLAALAFSFIGDLLLLSRDRSFLLAGIAAFFMAHIAFILAFLTVGFSIGIFAATLIAMAIFAWFVLRWLWQYLDSQSKMAVPIYLAAIAVMVSLGAAASAAEMPTTVAIGSIAFAASDVSVARDRFVERGLINKVWGIPLYYFAQMLLASSVGSAAVVSRIGT